jgi:signal transduction histidine kinase
MLSRLGIRQRLSLLLTLPLVAVVATLLPFSVDRVDQARSAAATVDAARQAQQIGRLVQELGTERLLAVGYLGLPALDSVAVVRQAQSVTDDVVQLRRTLGPGGTGIGAALDGLAGLDALRQAVLRRQAAPLGIFSAYRAAMISLIDALRLTSRSGIDLAGQRQLTALDALLRANQEASGLGAALVMATGVRRVSSAPDGGVQDALGNSFGAPVLFGDQFRRSARPGQSRLLDDVEHGSTGQQILGLARGFLLNDPAATRLTVQSAVTIADSYAELRRAVQERIARDVADRAQSRSTAARAAAAGSIGAALMIFILLVTLSVTVSRSIAWPLRRLTRAAAAVADLASAEMVRVADSDEVESGPPRLAAVDIRTADEMGELATAINRVQATAALLLERQISTRRNVSTMFTNIAQRTQSMAGRQLAFIDDLERDQQDTALLEKLYRLDHLTARLRRSADSLLVVSGWQDRSGIAEPTPLVDVIRSALGEIEGFRAVRLGKIGGVVIAADLVDDLRLLFAELLENGTAFSPPGAPVDVSVQLTEACEVTIVDHGIGMTLARMAEENQRLVERERLDVAPTTTLGLFVVGRLARRHGLGVHLTQTPGGGVTVRVSVPRRHIVSDEPAGFPRRSLLEMALPNFPMAILSDPHGAEQDFSWFEPEQIALSTAPHSEVVEGQPVERNDRNRTDAVQAEAFRAEPPAAGPAPAAPAWAGMFRREPTGVEPSGAGAGRAQPTADAFPADAASPDQPARGAAPGSNVFGSDPVGAQPSGAGPQRPAYSGPPRGGSFEAQPPGARQYGAGPIAPGEAFVVERAGHPEIRPTGTVAAPTGPGTAGPPPGWTSSGLSRRQPGANIPGFDPVLPHGEQPSRSASPAARDAEAERAELDAFQSGARAANKDSHAEEPAPRPWPPTGVAQPPSGIAQPPSGIAQPSAGVAQPPSGIAQPSAGVAQPPSGIAQPSAGVAQPPSRIAQPSAGMARPWAGVAQPPSGVARPPVAPPPAAADRPSAPVPQARAGLTRRVPGAHLADSLREAPPAGPVPGSGSDSAGRNADAERAALEGYTAGLERAMRSVSSSVQDQTHR